MLFLRRFFSADFQNKKVLFYTFLTKFFYLAR